MADSFLRTKQEETQFTQLLSAIRSGGGGGGGSTVEYTPTQTSGNEIGKLLVDGIEYVLFSKQSPTIEKSGKWTTIKFDNNFAISIFVDDNCYVNSWNWWGSIKESVMGISNLQFPYKFQHLPFVKISYPTLNAMADEFTYDEEGLQSVYAVRGSDGLSGRDTTAIVCVVGFIDDTI